MTTDSTKRFTDRVENYVRYRPGYPDEVAAILEMEFGWSRPQTIADIGSGTGISSELFVRHEHNDSRIFEFQYDTEIFAGRVQA